MGDGPHRYRHVVPRYRGTSRFFLPTRHDDRTQHAKSMALHFFDVFINIIFYSQMFPESVSILITNSYPLIGTYVHNSSGDHLNNIISLRATITIQMNGDVERGIFLQVFDTFSNRQHDHYSRGYQTANRARSMATLPPST